MPPSSRSNWNSIKNQLHSRFFKIKCGAKTIVPYVWIKWYTFLISYYFSIKKLSGNFCIICSTKTVLHFQDCRDNWYSTCYFEGMKISVIEIVNALLEILASRVLCKNSSVFSQSLSASTLTTVDEVNQWAFGKNRWSRWPASSKFELRWKK